MVKLLKLYWFPAMLFVVVAMVIIFELIRYNKRPALVILPADSAWVAPSLYTDQVTKGEERNLIIYGEELIAHTGKYFGPHGSIMQVTNGMNCQNCHLQAGTLP